MAQFKLNPLTGMFDLVDGAGGLVVVDQFSYEVVTGTADYSSESADGP